jgi:2-oxoglutarate dehydrogenase E1 component
MAEQLDKPSFLTGANSIFIENLYLRYRENPESVAPSWQQFFDGLTEDASIALGESAAASWTRSDWPIFPSEEEILNGGNGSAAEAEAPVVGGITEEEAHAATLDSIRALMYIRAYRVRGHLKANLDPLGLIEPANHPELDYRTYGFADAYLNPPQSGILGMHKIQNRPVAVGDEVVIRPMMYLALSYDHRIIDGREAETFLVRIKECIEDPTRLLLDL